MVQLNAKLVRKHLIYLMAINIIISLLLLNACSLQQSSQLPRKNRAYPQKPPPSTAKTAVKWKTPITIPKGEFFKVGGWLSNDEVLYVTNKEKTSSLYCYHLDSGKSTLLYKSEYPIGDIQISPKKKYILIQTSPSSYGAKITVIDSKGNEKYSQSIPSHELAFEWNPYHESEVLITIFQEDWSFHVALLNVTQKTLEQLSLPQPFLKWVNQKEVAYLNGDKNSPSLFAPLILHSLSNGSDQSLFSNVFQFTAFKDILMTITVNGKGQSKAKYSFFDPKLKSIYSFEIPQLTKYSDWLVPFYDYNEISHQFITFKPLKSTNADAYTEGFQLTIFNLLTGKNSVLLKGLDNEPISISPSGVYCLYGNRFEKLIDLKSKKIIDLVKEG